MRDGFIDKLKIWRERHREKLNHLELVLAGLFLFLAVCFLYLWLTDKPAVPPAPETAWKVEAEPGRWTQIVVHHTATEAGTAESIDRTHRLVNKWENGLGYHFLIGNGKKDMAGGSMEDGEVHVGQRWLKQLDGAHVIMKGTKKGNSFSIGIALVGNLEKNPPTEKQVASLVRLLRFLTTEYGISPEHVVGHGDISAKYTACPGKCLPLKELVKTL